MTTIAFIILTVLAAVNLLMTAGLILWQRKADARINNVQRHMAQHIGHVEKLLEELKQDQGISKELILKEIRKGIDEIEGPPAYDLGSDPQAACLSGKEEPENLQIEKDETIDALNEIPEQTEDMELLVGQEQHQIQDADPSRDSQTLETPIYNVGKSGKIYTEEELELLIRE